MAKTTTKKATIEIHDIKSGKSTAKLMPSWLSAELNNGLLRQVVMVDEARRRIRRAHTKDRKEVRGGGAKPWRQKGTGRARHASRRSPLWVGGGITFGPRAGKRSMARVTRRMRLEALRMVLGFKARANDLVVWKVGNDFPNKTKEVRKQTELRSGDLVVLGAANNNLGRAVRNINGVMVMTEAGLVCRAALAARRIIIDEETWMNLEKRLNQREAKGAAAAMPNK